MELYRQKEIEFPVRVAMARFMADQQAAAPARPALQPRGPVPLGGHALSGRLRERLERGGLPHPVAAPGCTRC